MTENAVLQHRKKINGKEQLYLAHFLKDNVC